MKLLALGRLSREFKPSSARLSSRQSESEIFLGAVFLCALTSQFICHDGTVLAWVPRAGLPSPFELPSLNARPHPQLKSPLARGICLTRLPVAAKMALHTAGASGGKAGSPRPVTG